MLERPGAIGQQEQLGLEAAAGAPYGVGGQEIAAADVGSIHTGQRQGGALTGPDRLGLAAVHLDATQPNLPVRWHDAHIGTGLDAATPHRPRHHRTDTANAERTIHGQTKKLVIAARVDPAGPRVDG